MSNKQQELLKEFNSIADTWFSQNTWLEKRYEFFLNFFDAKNLPRLNWDDFLDLHKHIHSYNPLTLPKSNEIIPANHSLEYYRKVFYYLKNDSDTIDIKINNILEKTSDYFLKHFSSSSLTEVAAHAFPSQYVPLNRKNLKVLHFLEIPLLNEPNSEYGEKFVNFNAAINPLLENYKTIVEKKTNTTLCLEFDQFLLWVYTNHFIGK